MEKKVICIIILTSLTLTIYYNYKMKNYDIDDYVKSQKICPITGNKTFYTSCIQDPDLNNAFIISVSSIKNISEIQKSLNDNDKLIEIKENNKGYFMINNKNKNIQLIPKCEDMNKEDIMKKIETKNIYSSV